MYALGHVTLIYLWRGDYEQVESLAGELIPLAQEKGAIFWKGGGMGYRGCLFALTSDSEVLKAKAIEMLSAGLTTQTSTGATSCAKVRKSYCPNSARAVSTRARVGLWPNCENIRFASVRC